VHFVGLFFVFIIENAWSKKQKIRFWYHGNNKYLWFHVKLVWIK